MIPRTIRGSFTSRLGLANYSSINAEAEMTADLDDGEDPAEALAQLLTLCRESVKAQLVAKPAADPNSTGGWT